MINKDAIVACLQEHGYELESRSKNPQYQCMGFEKKNSSGTINIDFIEEKEGNLCRFGICFALTESKVPQILNIAKGLDFTSTIWQKKKNAKKFYYFTFPLIKSGINVNSLTEGLNHLEKFIYEIHRIESSEGSS